MAQEALVQPLFIAERAVGIDGDLLFKEKPLGAELDRVAEHIIQSVNGSIASPSITFLISGKWGSGKSSALRYIEDRIRGAAGDGVVFANYPAPLYDVRPSNARASLMHVLIRATDRHAAEHPGALNDPRPSSLLADLLRGALVRDDQKAVSAATAEEREVITEVQDDLLLIEALEHSTRTGVILERWLSEYRHRRGKTNPTTVVFVDDLDRCTPEFATDVLVATNYWSQLEGHYFVLGAEEERLKEALTERLDPNIGAPDRGLRKYVHVTVEVSATLGQVPDGKRMFGAFLEQIALTPEVRKQLEEQLALVADKPDGEWTALEPLVNASCSGNPGAYTPRIFKERFNTLAIRLGSETGAVEAVSTSELKRQIARLVWPAEWASRLSPALLGVPTARGWCAAFIELGVQAQSYARHAQRQRVEQLAAESGLVLGDADPLLAVYLASHPLYVFETDVTPKGGERPVKPDAISQEPGAVLDPKAVLPSELSSILSGSQGLADQGGLHERSELVELLSELQLVAELGDEARTKDLLNRVRDLLPSIDVDAGFAPSLGNVALRLTPLGLVGEAASLHLLAIQVDPYHANANQNFVDFVIDHPFPQLTESAEEALERLETVPDMQSWKPLRTRVLRATFDAQHGRPPTEDLAELVADATAEDADLGVSELINLTSVIERVKKFELLPPLGGAMLDRERGDPGAQAATMRVLADEMAQSDKPEDEEFAAELYRFMCMSGLIRLLTRDASIGDTLFNLGLLLGSRGLRERPTYLFWQALRFNEGDDRIRLRLARSFNDTGDAASAERLVAGPVPMDQLPPPPGAPFREPLLPRSRAAQGFISGYLESRYDEPLIPEFFTDEG